MRVLLIAGMTGSLMAAEPENLFTNGGFETNPNGAAYGWNFELNSDSGAQATRVDRFNDGNRHGGKRLLPYHRNDGFQSGLACTDERSDMAGR